jgi:hypothetical protein
LFQRVLTRFVVFVKAVRHAAVGGDIATLDEPCTALFDQLGILTALFEDLGQFADPLVHHSGPDQMRRGHVAVDFDDRVGEQHVPATTRLGAGSPLGCYA